MEEKYDTVKMNICIWKNNDFYEHCRARLGFDCISNSYGFIYIPNSFDDANTQDIFESILYYGFNKAIDMIDILPDITLKQAMIDFNEISSSDNYKRTHSNELIDRLCEKIDDLFIYVINFPH